MTAVSKPWSNTCGRLINKSQKNLPTKSKLTDCQKKPKARRKKMLEQRVPKHTRVSTLFTTTQMMLRQQSGSGLFYILLFRPEESLSSWKSGTPTVTGWRCGQNRISKRSPLTEGGKYSFGIRTFTFRANRSFCTGRKYQFLKFMLTNITFIFVNRHILIAPATAVFLFWVLTGPLLANLSRRDSHFWDHHFHNDEYDCKNRNQTK